MHDQQQPAQSIWPAGLATAVVHATESVLLVLDAGGNIRYANPAACTALQSTQTWLIGKSFSDVLDEGSRDKARTLLELVRSGEPTHAFELNQIAADGTRVLLSYRASQLVGTDESAHILLTGQLLTDTVSTTQRLLALNRRLSALFSIASSVSRSIVLTDLLRQALSVMIAELELQAGAVFLADVPLYIDRSQPLPLTADQLQLVVYQGFAPMFVPRLNEAQRWVTFGNRNLRDGTQSVIIGYAEELGISADDLTTSAGPMLSVAATPLISDDRLFGWLYVLTDRYRAFQSDELDLLSTIGRLLGPSVENARLYQALLETSGQLHALLEGIDSGVLLTDQHGIVRYTNTRLGTFFDTDVATWIDRPRAAVMPTTLTRLEHEESLFDGELWEFAGTQRRVLSRFVEQVYDLTGTSLGGIEVFSDVTQVQEMNQLKDEFVAAAAHDLKTPVTAIKGYAQIGLRLARQLGAERLIQQLAMIDARSTELSHLMDALLDLSRLQAGRFELAFETFDVGDLVRSAAQHFAFDLRRRGRELVLDLPPTPVQVTWDRTRMLGVLINLIGNGIKYSPDGGIVEVRVALAPHDDAVQLTVTDYGIGIPVAERERIFDRFYRTREAVEGSFKGTGIGLYISRRVVELHGGTIEAIAALHGGTGSTMVLVLPRYVAQLQKTG